MNLPFGRRVSPVVRHGMVGLVVTVALALAALQLDQLPFVRTGAEHEAYFADAGGLLPGDPVQVAGVRSGRVAQVRLEGARVLVRFSLSDDIVLGTQTTAAIKTNTVLGRKSLEVAPAGPGVLRRDDPIPLAHTTSPYSLEDALNDAATTVSGLDTGQLDRALDTISQAFADTPAPLRSALDGISALSHSVATRDQALSELVRRARGVTTVLADRAEQLDALLVDGNDLFGELDSRRSALSQLIVYVDGLAQQLRGFVADNEQRLKPTLTKLNSVLALLQHDKDQLGRALDALGPFEAALGEQVGSGPYFQAYVSNASSLSLRPLIDALVWPDRVPESLREYLDHPPFSVGPAVQEPPR